MGQKEITRVLRKYFEQNHNKTQHIKVCVMKLKPYNRGKLIVLNDTFKKEECSQTNYLSF